MKDINIAKSRNFLLRESVELDEMAKITGDLKTAIEAVIASNPELTGLPLKKAIKSDEAVINALAGDDLYDNQLNKFIATAKGERPTTTRGRQPLGANDALKSINKSQLTPKDLEKGITSELEPEIEDDEITDTWNTPEEEEEEVGTPTIDKSLESEIPTDVSAANGYKNIIVKKVAKIEALPPQDRAKSVDMAALKSFIKKPEVVKALTVPTIRSLVSTIIG